MKYDRGDSFPFDFESNGIISKWNHDHIPFNLKGNRMLAFSVCTKVGQLSVSATPFWFIFLDDIFRKTAKKS